MAERRMDARLRLNGWLLDGRQLRCCLRGQLSPWLRLCRQQWLVLLSRQLFSSCFGRFALQAAWRGGIRRESFIGLVHCIVRLGGSRASGGFRWHRGRAASRGDRHWLEDPWAEPCSHGCGFVQSRIRFEGTSRGALLLLDRRQPLDRTVAHRWGSHVGNHDGGENSGHEFEVVHLLRLQTVRKTPSSLHIAACDGRPVRIVLKDPTTGDADGYDNRRACSG